MSLFVVAVTCDHLIRKLNISSYYRGYIDTLKAIYLLAILYVSMD
jgi:hypothetical protein